jgi:hypothetical protein
VLIASSAVSHCIVSMADLFEIVDVIKLLITVMLNVSVDRTLVGASTKLCVEYC